MCEYLCLTGEFRLRSDTVRDYIKDPKGSGYRTLQLVVDVKVVMPTGVQWVPCELQLRTEIQHTWSEVEHELVYKNRRLGKVEDTEKWFLKETMKNSMNILHCVDESLQNIRDEVKRLTQGIE
jgi:putative GTP pyrophosphokinase